MKNDPLRILIVEDEAILAMELEGLIEDEGHEVVGWATSLEQARNILDEADADIAFVDLHLIDGPTGLDVAQYIGERGDRPVAVFLTANPKRIPDDFRGALGVISKPYTVKGLCASLRYLEEGVRRPPPAGTLPVELRLSPGYQAIWGGSGTPSN